MICHARGKDRPLPAPDDRHAGTADHKCGNAPVPGQQHGGEDHRRQDVEAICGFFDRVGWERSQGDHHDANHRDLSCPAEAPKMCYQQSTDQKQANCIGCGEFPLLSNQCYEHQNGDGRCADR